MAEQKIKGVKKFFEEFKAFAMRGNVLDMAVGVVVGSAFTAIVNSLVGDVINPLIGLFFNNDFSEVVVKIGSFISAIINFLIVAPSAPPSWKASPRSTTEFPEKHSAPVHCKIAVSGGAFL